MLARLLAVLRPADRPALEAAAAFASRVHAGELDDDGTPYILHPLRVALVLAEEAGCADLDTLSAALLHDTQEHFPAVTAAEVSAAAGPHAACWAGALAFEHRRNPGVPKETSRIHYLEALRRGPDHLKLIKMADRLDNLRECVRLGEKKQLAKRLRQEREDYADIFAPVPGSEAEALRARIGFFLEEDKRNQLPEG